MLITFLDTETNGLPEDPAAKPIEVACVTVDFTAKRVVRAFSETVNFFGPNVVNADTREVHGMTSDFVSEHGICELGSVGSDFLERVSNAMTKVDAVFARNGLAFDQGMMNRLFLPNGMPAVIWIDDYFDIQYPAFVKGRNLSHIAADHGFLNPFAHSALGDTLTLAYVMLKGGYDMQAALESAKQPLVQVFADVEFKDKDLAKKAGFQWNPIRKKWFKFMRNHQADVLIAAHNFQIVKMPTDSATLSIWQKEARA